jgi:hypothetical protein
MTTDSIDIIRRFDDFQIRGTADYDGRLDHWEIVVIDHYGREERKESSDAWPDLAIMISHAIASSHRRRGELALCSRRNPRRAAAFMTTEPPPTAEKPRAVANALNIEAQRLENFISVLRANVKLGATRLERAMLKDFLAQC